MQALFSHSPPPIPLQLTNKIERGTVAGPGSGGYKRGEGGGVGGGREGETGGEAEGGVGRGVGRTMLEE